MNFFTQLIPQITAHEKTLSSQMWQISPKGSAVDCIIQGHIKLCRLGLQNIIGRVQYYETNCQLNTPFREHFALTIQHKRLTPDDMFELIEDMSVFAYEALLRSEIPHGTETEEALLAMMLINGDWQRETSTLLQQYMTEHIPAAVQQATAKIPVKQSR